MSDTQSLSQLGSTLVKAVCALPSIRENRRWYINRLETSYRESLLEHNEACDAVHSAFEDWGLRVAMPTDYAVQTDSQVLASIESHRTATDSTTALRRLFSAIRNGLQTDHYKQSEHTWNDAHSTVKKRIELLHQLKTDVVHADSKLRDSIIRAISVTNLPTDQPSNQEDMVYQALVCAAQKRLYSPEHVDNNDSCRVAVPHPTLLGWTIRHAEATHPALPLIAWVTDTETYVEDTTSGYQYDALLKYVLSDSPSIEFVVHQSQLVDETIDIHPFFVRPPESPRTSYKKFRKSPYTISHGYIRTKFAEEHNIANEDYLLFDFKDDDFIAIVSDGASQSLMSYIAARHVSEYLYRLWIDCAGSSNLADIERRTRSALAAAKHATHAESSRAVDLLFENNIYPQSTLELLRKRQKAGSQAIFACVFRRNDILTLIWMGNSRIFVEGSVSGKVVHHDDPRFSDDKSRFGSAAPMGTYGTLHIQQFDTRNGTDPDFLSINDKWRIVIHSDALEVYEEPDHLYNAPLQPPSLFPVNIDADLLEKCIEHDDTTIIEIYYERQG